ncbi:ERAP1-like C-terminal domain-containing protein, partial [Acinetobacter baumannii]|nr:ERAP1-like C-terminal domain-containing protein [Acinetobacter baumannii]
YSLHGEDLVRTNLIDLTISSPRTPVPEAAGKPAPDLILINDDDLTYAKVRLGATGTKTVLAHLSGLADPLARALVWSMLWNSVRDAKLKVQDYLDAVAAHGPKETEPAILATVLQ